MPFYVMSRHLISRHVMLYMLNITQSLITSQSLNIIIYVYLSFLYLLIDGPIYLPFHTPSILAIILSGWNSHALLKKRTDRPNGFPGWDVLYVRKMSGHMFWTHYLGVDFGPLVLLLHPSTTSLSLESERILCRFFRETDRTSSKPTTSHKITRFCKNLISTIKYRQKSHIADHLKNLDLSENNVPPKSTGISSYLPPKIVLFGVMHTPFSDIPIEHLSHCSCTLPRGFFLSVAVVPSKHAPTAAGKVPRDPGQKCQGQNSKWRV